MHFIFSVAIIDEKENNLKSNRVYFRCNQKVHKRLELSDFILIFLFLSKNINKIADKIVRFNNLIENIYIKLIHTAILSHF